MLHVDSTWTNCSLSINIWDEAVWSYPFLNLHLAFCETQKQGHRRLTIGIGTYEWIDDRQFVDESIKVYSEQTGNNEADMVSDTSTR